MAKLAEDKGALANENFPVITRINNVKLRHAVFPGDLMEMEVVLKEQVGSASYLTGQVRVGEKTVLTLEFTAMLVKETA